MTVQDIDRQPRPLIRMVAECPREVMEGVEIVRVLAGTAFDKVGCEYVVLKKGQELDSHLHKKANSFILVLEGRGVVELDGVEHRIEPGHTVYVPAGVLHGFRAPSEDLVLYGFQSPPIIEDENNIDILFTKTGKQGRIERVNQDASDQVASPAS